MNTTRRGFLGTVAAAFAGAGLVKMDTAAAEIAAIDAVNDECDDDEESSSSLDSWACSCSHHGNNVPGCICWQEPKLSLRKPPVPVRYVP